VGEERWKREEGGWRVATPSTDGKCGSLWLYLAFDTPHLVAADFGSYLIILIWDISLPLASTLILSPQVV
jgi:hypothetical protein